MRPPKIPPTAPRTASGNRVQIHSGGIMDELMTVVPEGTSYRMAERVINAFLATILVHAKSGEVVHIDRFGTFTISHHKAKEGVSFFTGGKTFHPARTVLKFRPVPLVNEPFDFNPAAYTPPPRRRYKKVNAYKNSANSSAAPVPPPPQISS